MLLLAQTAHETIVLETRDGPIELRLHLIEGKQARIGIEAPSSVRVVRRSDPSVQKQISDPLDDAEWWRHPDD
jgi:sRNA-binding carbon storage regulator CsrA